MGQLVSDIQKSSYYCEFQFHLNIVYSVNMNLALLAFLWVELLLSSAQKLYGHFAQVSYLQNTVSVKVHGICNIQTEFKFAVLKE